MRLQSMVAGGVLLLSAHLGGQELPPSLTAIAREIAGDSGSTFERTSRLVGWINTQFEWSASDYQQRSVDWSHSRGISRLGGIAPGTRPEFCIVT